MSFASLIPIIVSVLTIVGGAVVYQIQKAVDRHIELKRERREMYRRYVCIFEEFDHVLTSEGPQSPQTFSLLNDLKKVTAEIFVSAPDPVVKASEPIPKLFLAVGKHSFKDDEGYDEQKMLMARQHLYVARASLVTAMRADTYEDTNVNSPTIEASMAGLKVSLGMRQA